MATFSTNQTRQLYVAKARQTSALTSNSTVGDIYVPNNSASDKSIQFVYMGKGGLVASDIIPHDNIISAKATKYTSLQRKLKKKTIALDSSVNGGKVISGEDYILGFTIYEYGAPSMEMNYYKDVAVRGTSAMTANPALFYIKLKELCEKTFSTESIKYFNFSYSGTQASYTVADEFKATAKDYGAIGNNLKITLSIAAATAGCTVSTTSGITTIAIGVLSTAKTVGDVISAVESSPVASALISIATNGSATSSTTASAISSAVALTGGTDGVLTVEEAVQPWVRGKIQDRPLMFNIEARDVYVSSTKEDLIWGVITDVTSNLTVVANGKKFADLEWFCMGERGDVYRQSGYPYNIDTEYIVNPTLNYNIIDISYYYEGPGTDNAKSQKTISVIVEETAAVTITNNIITDINTTYGTAGFIPALS